jgi:hypothetical protein
MDYFLKQHGYAVPVRIAVRSGGKISGKKTEEINSMA